MAKELQRAKAIENEMKDLAAGAEEQGRERKKASSLGSSWVGRISEWPKESRTFLEDVRAETRRVTWPTWGQVRATTVVVIITVFLFGIYFGVLDWLYTRGIGWLLRVAS